MQLQGSCLEAGTSNVANIHLLIENMPCLLAKTKNQGMFCIVFSVLVWREMRHLRRRRHSQVILVSRKKGTMGSVKKKRRKKIAKHKRRKQLKAMRHKKK